MAPPETVTPDEERIGALHRAWFVAVLGVYVVFLALIPPFQTNDEVGHWQRMWSVADGHLTCGEIPRSAIELSWRFEQVRVSSRMSPALLHQRGSGRPERMPMGGMACSYIPLSYVAPAVLARLVANPFDPSRPSRMLVAFYVARAFSLLLLAVSVLLFMRVAPALRSLTLTLYSLPMVIQQSISINQESTILCLAFCILVLWWKAPSVRQVLGLLCAVTLLAFTKPVYLVLLLLWAGSLLRLRSVGVTWARIVALSTLVVIPLGTCGAWWSFVAGRPEMLRNLPAWVSVPAQVDWVREHPIALWRIFVTQLHDLLGRDPLRGGWTSVLGVLGWADYGIGERAYDALLASIPIALGADLLARPASGAAERRSALAYVLPIVAAVLIVAAITIAMYLQFSVPHADYAMGMTGRYLHLPYFFVLAALLLWARATPLARRAAEAVQQRPRMRWVPGGLIALCAALCLLAAHDAIRAIWLKYYG